MARKDFSTFGDETLTAQRTAALGYKPENIRQDYTGYQKDDESGLEYAQARYYNSSHGRFTGVDPLTASATIRDPQTFNRYSYALNSPYKFTDPLGLISVEKQNEGAGPTENTGGSPAEGTPTDEEPEPPPPPDTPEEIDQKLTQVFTDTGTVIGANSTHLKDYKTGEVLDNHTQFANGVVHTVHVVGEDAGVFIPQGFTDVKITSKDTVVARNPKTGEVLMIAHVQVGEGKSGDALLKKNMKIIRENGTMYIGKTGGKGGEGAPAVGIGKVTLPHSHIQYHPSESHRIQAYNKIVADRKVLGSSADFTQKDYSSHVSDFRNFVK